MFPLLIYIMPIKPLKYSRSIDSRWGIYTAIPMLVLLMLL
jgi:hypothetical protein